MTQRHKKPSPTPSTPTTDDWSENSTFYTVVMNASWDGTLNRSGKRTQMPSMCIAYRVFLEDARISPEPQDFFYVIVSTTPASEVVHNPVSVTTSKGVGEAVTAVGALLKDLVGEVEAKLPEFLHEHVGVMGGSQHAEHPVLKKLFLGVGEILKSTMTEEDLMAPPATAPSVPGDQPHSVTIPLRSSDAPLVGDLPDKTIVKVQVAMRPVSGGSRTTIPDPSAPAKVYDRERTPVWDKFLPYESVKDKMAGRVKAFFYATIQWGQIVLGDEAPWQEW